MQQLTLEIGALGSVLEVRDGNGTLVAIADCNDGNIYAASDAPDAPPIGTFEITGGWVAWEIAILSAVSDELALTTAHAVPVSAGGKV